MVCRRPALWLGLTWVLAIGTARAEAIVDSHVHFKWTQSDTTTAAQAIDILRQQDVSLAVVIGTPADLALALAQVAPERILPVFGPYRIGGDWYRWQYDPDLLDRARRALASGRYHGIGELHLVGGFARRLDRHANLRGLLELGREFDVPLLIHTEFSSPEPMLAICRGFPDVRIQWAHSGAILPPAEVGRVLEQCANVWAELSARDPWRYVDHPITDADGRLLPGWEALVLAYPGRFLVGSDPVWPVDRIDGWDRPDTGWQELARFLDFHRRWLAFLPPEVRRRVAVENALDLYQADGRR